MRAPSHRYADMASEAFGDIDGINQTLGLKALAGGNRGGAATDYADGISFRKKNISSDGLGYARFPYDGTSILSGIGRGMGLFQFYDSPIDFCSIFAVPTGTNNSKPAEDISIDSWAIGATAVQENLTAPTDIGLSGLVSHTALNGYDIIADGVNFNRIAGSSRNYAPILQQPAAPGLASSTTIPFSYSSQFGSQNAPFVNPSGIAVDGSANTYIADGAKIFKFNSTFVQQTLAITGVTPISLRGVYVDGSGNIFVCDPGAGAVYKLNSSGAYQSSFTSTPANFQPEFIAVDGSGNFWVTDFLNKKITKFDSSYVFQSSIAMNLGGTPIGIYIASSGNIYVTCNGSTGNGVQIFVSGAYSANFTGYTFSSLSAAGITFDGTYFNVIDSSNNCIVIFNASGVFQYTIGSIGSGNGQLNSPFGSAYASNLLYVVDQNNYRVEVFTNSGSGTLTGDYAYCLTLVDNDLNESSPSALSVINGLSAKNVQLTADLNGLQLAANNWNLIRTYRTLTNPNPVTASQNPTFYYVPGLDQIISPTQSTYTYIDSIPDTTLESVNNYQMTNINYENGALDNLPAGWTPKFVMAWLGVTFGANWTDPNGVNYPRRVMWSASTDNSQVSNGNITSWSSFDYDDVGDARVGDILGVYPGLQGRAYIWCKNGTFLILATGNATEPYDFVQISNQYGFYHNTVAEVTGGVMGRTKDGFAIFNGALFTHISHNILKTLGQCISPDGDSGAFDFNTQRYYCAVADSSLMQSSLPTVQGTGTQNTVFSASILNCMRNEVLVYDMPTKRWEIYQRTPIQYFATFADTSGTNGNSGKPGIFGVGMSSDIYFVTQGNACGATYSGIVAGDGVSAVEFPGVQIPVNFVGKDVYIPFSIGADGESFTFIGYKSTISSVVYTAPNSVVGLTDGAPDNVSNFMVMIDNAGGETISTSYPITDNNNLFLKAGSYGFGIANLDPNTLALEYQSNLPETYYNNGNYVDSVAANALSLVTEVATFETPTLYTQLPYRWFNQFSSVPHLISFMTPPSGYKSQEHRKKNYQYLMMKMSCSGPLKIDIFMDTIWTPNNNAVPTSTIYLTGTSQLNLPNMQEVRIPIGNNLGYIMRARITGIRGLTKFEIDDIVPLWTWLAVYSAQ